MGMLDNISLGLGNANPSEILKELLNKLEIETKTDVSIEQIRTISQINLYCMLLDGKYIRENSPSDIMRNSVLYYLALKISQNRESRKEIIRGVSELRQSPEVQSPLKPKQ